MDSLGFTFPEMGDNYTVHYKEDQGGMEVLYDITNIFLDAVIGGKFFPDEFLSEEKFPDLESVKSNFLNEVIDNVQPIIMTNISILVCIVLGLLLSLVTLIGGIIFCCCCRGKNQKSNDNGFKKVMLSILLFILLVVTSLGCMWFFLGAKTSQSGLDKIPEDIKDILHDGDLYMNNTVDELRYLLQENFDEVIINFTDALDQVGEDFKDFTETMKNEIQLQKIIDEATSFIDLLTDYTDITGQMGSFITSYTKITKSLEAIQTAATFCGPDQLPIYEEICNAINAASGIFESSFPSILTTTSLPQLPGEQQLSVLIETLINIELQIDEISANAISDYFPGIQKQIEDIKGFLTDALDGLTEPIEEIQAQIFRNDDITDILETIRDEYFPYFNLSLLVLGSILVVILAVFMIGMCLGSCSKPGSGIASTSSGIMFFANGLFFFLAIFLFILCTAFFTVGALGEKALCKTMENPEDSELVTFVNPLLSSELTKIYNSARPEGDGDIEVEFDLAQIISDMNNNTAIYPLLQLHYIFNIGDLTDWKETYEINPIINTARDIINKTIEDLVNSKDTLNKDEVIAIASKIDDLTAEIDFSSLIDSTLSDALNTAKEEFKTLTGTINGMPNDVDGKQDILDNLQIITVEFGVLIQNVKTLQASLIQVLNFFGDGSTKFNMTGKVSDTFDLVEAAFAYIGGDAVMDFFEESVTALTKVVDDYVALAINAAENRIGNTEPLSNIYNATYTNICMEIVAPFNTVWSGLGWCLLMILIPVTLLVTSLRKIFSATEPAPSMRPHDANGYKNTRNPAARAVSYEEVPMPAYNERNSRINAYEPRAPPYQPNHQTSYQNGPPPYHSNQSSSRR